MYAVRSKAPVPGTEDGALAPGVTDGVGRIVVGPASAELRRSLRPIEWVVLEDVALDARPDADGALVAPTSARRVAEHLGLTPGAAAGALARLRSAGLVIHARQAGPAGRFGLSAYVLGPVPGLDVLDAAEALESVPPRIAPPPMAPPRVVEPHMVETDVAEPESSSGARPARARRSAATSAPATAPVPPVSEPAPATASVGRPSATDHRRPTGRPPVGQLSMLDAFADSHPDTTPDQLP